MRERDGSMRMKPDRKRLRIALLIAFVAVAFAAAAQNVSITDYRTPVSRARSLLVDLNYDYERVASDTLSNDGRVGVDYSLFYESLPFAYSINSTAAWSRAWANESFVTSYGADTAARVKKFAWKRRDLFGSVRLNGDFDKGDDQPASSVTVGVGWGRFINATALRKAVRIDTFFVNEGVTSARMPKASMLEIAKIIQREREYRQNFGGDTYSKFWFEDIEQAVHDSGRLTGESIGAGGILRMNEALFIENIGERFFGWDATLGVRYALTVAESGLARPSPAADLSVRYARPISWKTQLDVRATATSPLAQDRFGNDFTLVTTGVFFYEVTNRVDLRLDYRFDLERFGETNETLMSHSILPSFLFYLEDELRLLAGVRLIRHEDDPWRQELTMTLNYKAF